MRFTDKVLHLVVDQLHYNILTYSHTGYHFDLMLSPLPDLYIHFSEKYFHILLRHIQKVA